MLVSLDPTLVIQKKIIHNPKEKVKLYWKTWSKEKKDQTQGKARRENFFWLSSAQNASLCKKLLAFAQALLQMQSKLRFEGNKSHC
jgi:hypothetical protein